MMSPDNLENPEALERWCSERRDQVSEYLKSQSIEHGRVGEWPAWHVAPYVSIWAIESITRPNWIGWWVICGDLPTDYISSAAIDPPQHPRKALLAFAERWLKIVEAWKAGREYEGVRIAGPHSHEGLAPLLEARALLFHEWADDDTQWVG
jgi:hypothetical protein